MKLSSCDINIIIAYCILILSIARFVLKSGKGKKKDRNRYFLPVKQLVFICLFAFCVLGQLNAQYKTPRLSPRPTNVSGVKQCALSLNGMWQVKTSTLEKQVEVPGELTMQGVPVPEGENAVYSMNFNVPADWQGKRIKIRFDGVSPYGKVIVNNQTVGEHEGGMVPFELDITEAVQTGNVNTLQVLVQSMTVSDRLGCISQYASHLVTGLIRKVSVYVLPQTNIASLNAVTVLDKSYQNAKLTIKSDIAFENSSISAGKTEVEFTLKDSAGKKVTSQRLPVDKSGKINAVLSVNKARLWNPEQPYLYTLITTLYTGNAIQQVNEQKIGLRQVEVKGNLLLVNGSPVKLHGVDRHETHPLRGRSLTPALCRKDAEIFRAGNCNYIRTSHYPPSEEFLEACDELGLFVECESALTWIEHGAAPIWKNWDYRDKKYLPYLVGANLDKIVAFRNHPCIVIWSMGNESFWSDLWAETLKACKALDPSRPYTMHDQCWGSYNNGGNRCDIANYHYPGMNGPAACDTMKRPTLFGEYAHLSCYNRTELTTDPGIRAAYGKPLVQMVDSIFKHPACLGGALWSGIDDIFHLPDGEIVGYGPWGPIDGWRRLKPEYTGMKNAYAPVRILKHEKTDEGFILTLENRYDFINLNQTKIEIYSGSNYWKAIPGINIKPHATGSFLIPTMGGDKYIHLKITDPRGFVCVEEIIGDVSEIKIEEEKNYTLRVDENDNAVFIQYQDKDSQKKILYTLSKVTGLITQAAVNGSLALVQGPVFCMVPMESNNGGKPNVANETYQNNIYPIKNYPLLTIFAKDFSYKKEENRLIVDVTAQYQSEEEGKLTYTFDNSGNVRLDYEIKLAENVNPRQYGMLFQLPIQMHNLSWSRTGEFSYYLGNDIARTKGKASLGALPVYEVETWGKEPSGDWKDDANILGSVDFRATKTQIESVYLYDGKSSLEIFGNGKQASRSWLQDGRIQLLIADYNNAGSEPFYGSPFTSDRIKLKKGDTVKGNVIFELQ